MHTYRLYVSEIPMQIKSYLYMVYSYINETKTQKNKKIVAHRNKTPSYIQKFNDQNYILLFFHWLRKYLMAPRCGKYAVQSTSGNPFHSNQGSATVEAVCVIPLMLFAFWAFYSMGQIFIVENQIYQAAMNTADYLAEYAYLVEDTELEILGYGATQVKLRQFLPKPERVEQYVVGGTSGILITNPVALDEEGFVSIHLQYWMRIPVPILGDLSMPMQVRVRQKAYTGYQPRRDADASQRYVYLAENGTVYHSSRSCTHLDLTIIPVTSLALQTNLPNLASCEYCGDDDTGNYYVTATGECYHTSVQCSGLKRTVRRVPLSEVNGYLPCSRCGE